MANLNQDVELLTIARLLRLLEPLHEDARYRVVQYVADRNNMNVGRLYRTIETSPSGTPEATDMSAEPLPEAGSGPLLEVTKEAARAVE